MGETYCDKEPAKKASYSVLEKNVLCWKNGEEEESKLRNCYFPTGIIHVVLLDGELSQAL